MLNDKYRIERLERQLAELRQIVKRVPARIGDMHTARSQDLRYTEVYAIDSDTEQPTQVKTLTWDTDHYETTGAEYRIGGATTDHKFVVGDRLWIIRNTSSGRWEPADEDRRVLASGTDEVPDVLIDKLNDIEEYDEGLHQPVYFETVPGMGGKPNDKIRAFTNTGADGNTNQVTHAIVTLDEPFDYTGIPALAAVASVDFYWGVGTPSAPTIELVADGDWAFVNYKAGDKVMVIRRTDGLGVGWYALQYEYPPQLLWGFLTEESEEGETIEPDSGLYTAQLIRYVSGPPDTSASYASIDDVTIFFVDGTSTELRHLERLIGFRVGFDSENDVPLYAVVPKKPRAFIGFTTGEVSADDADFEVEAPEPIYGAAPESPITVSQIFEVGYAASSPVLVFEREDGTWVNTPDTGKVRLDVTDEHPGFLFEKLEDTDTFDEEAHQAVYAQLLINAGNGTLKLFTAKHVGGGGGVGVLSATPVLVRGGVEGAQKVGAGPKIRPTYIFAADQKVEQLETDANGDLVPTGVFLDAIYRSKEEVPEPASGSVWNGELFPTADGNLLIVYCGEWGEETE